jgi:hypothetical protein
MYFFLNARAQLGYSPDCGDILGSKGMIGYGERRANRWSG